MPAISMLLLFKTLIYLLIIGFEKFSKIINLFPVEFAGQNSSSGPQLSAGQSSKPLLVST